MGKFQWGKFKHLFLSLAMLLGCVKDGSFKVPRPNCTAAVVENIGYRELKDMYKGETVEILEDLILAGYITSSDQMGNFFGILHFQDRPVDPTEGFQIEIDVRDSYLLYPVGSKVLIKLRGLYLGKSRGIFKIGGQYTSFGNISVGRLPAAVVDQHLFVSCDAVKIMEPVQITLADLTGDLASTLVQIHNIEIKEGELGLSFADTKVETKR